MKKRDSLRRAMGLVQALLLVLAIGPVCALLLYVLPALPGALVRMTQEKDFWTAFGNSVIICCIAVPLRFVIAVLGGYALAQWRFPGRRLLLHACVIAVLLPPQTLVMPQRLMLDALSLIDTRAALILTGSVDPFGVLLLWYGFARIPREMIETAYCEGANPGQLLSRVALPMAKPYFIALLVISLADLWNSFEQPMAFLKNSALYPLSVYLAQVTPSDAMLWYTECLAAILMLLAFFLTLTDANYEIKC